MPTTRAAPIGDGLALGLSGLCLAHCLALPLLASLLPLFGAWAEADWVHWLFVGLAAPVSVWALWSSARTAPWLVGIAVAGLTIMALAAAEIPNHALETPMTVVGSLVLAVAHAWNWRLRSQCPRTTD